MADQAIYTIYILSLNLIKFLIKINNKYKNKTIILLNTKTSENIAKYFLPNSQTIPFHLTNNLIRIKFP